MSLQCVTSQAMNTDPVGLASWLRERLDGGEPVSAILDHAAALELHPISIALCLDGPGWANKDKQAANRRVARTLGICDPWISQIQSDGLRIRDPQIRELPEGLVVRRLDLSRLKGLVQIPERTYARWMRIHQCHSLVRVPKIRGIKKLELYDSHRLSELPEGLDLEDLSISACPALEMLPIIRALHMNISSCVHLRRIPDGVWFYQLVIARLPNLEGPLPTSGLSEGAKTRVIDCPGVMGNENP